MPEISNNVFVWRRSYKFPGRLLLCAWQLLSLRYITDIVFLLGYIGEFEEVDDHRSGKIVIQLNGRSVDSCFTLSIKNCKG